MRKCLDTIGLGHGGRMLLTDEDLARPIVRFEVSQTAALLARIFPLDDSQRANSGILHFN